MSKVTHTIEREHLAEAAKRSQSDLLTVNEFAEILRIDATTARRWIKSGVLEAISLPHQNLRQSYRIKRSTLEKLLETTSATS